MSDIQQPINDIIALNNHLLERGDYLVQYYRENGQKAVVLKGQSLRPYYPTPYERPCGDIDLWVVPAPGVSLHQHRKQVLNDLREAGIQYDEVVYHHTHAHFYEDAEVELHFTPSWMFNPILNHRLQQWFRTQSNHLDYRIYLTIHAFRHLYSSGIPEKQREDLKHVLAVEGEPDAQTIATLRHLGLRQFYHDFTNWNMPLQKIRPWSYPRERIWKQPWRVWHFIWRFINGYLIKAKE